MDSKDKTIYISRRCEHCHELLIKLHKNKNIFKFPVIDVDTKPYPKIVKSVPCMVIDNQLLPGIELFKFLDYLINQSNPKQEEKPQEKQPDLLPTANNGMIPGQMTEPSQMRNLNQPPEDNTQKAPSSDGELDLPGFCVGGACDLGFSPLEGDDLGMDSFEYLEGDESTKSCQIDNNITNKGEKSKQMDDDYSRMIQERGNDMGGSNQVPPR